MSLNPISYRKGIGGWSYFFSRSGEVNNNPLCIPSVFEAPNT